MRFPCLQIRFSGAYQKDDWALREPSTLRSSNTTPCVKSKDEAVISAQVRDKKPAHGKRWPTRSSEFSSAPISTDYIFTFRSGFPLHFQQPHMGAVLLALPFPLFLRNGRETLNCEVVTLNLGLLTVQTWEGVGQKLGKGKPQSPAAQLGTKNKYKLNDPNLTLLFLPLFFRSGANRRPGVKISLALILGEKAPCTGCLLLAGTHRAAPMRFTIHSVTMANQPHFFSDFCLIFC